MPLVVAAFIKKLSPSSRKYFYLDMRHSAQPWRLAAGVKL